MKQTQQSLLIVGLVLIGVIARLMTHVPNFVPTTALALVGGFYLRGRFSLVIPLLISLIADAFIGFYTWPVMVAVYSSYAVIALLGSYARRQGGLAALIPATLSSSVIFFLVTNAAVWAFTDMYVKTLAGLGQSYVMGLPFFRATLASDVIYTAAFVAVVEASLCFAPAKQVASQQV